MNLSVKYRLKQLSINNNFFMFNFLKYYSMRMTTACDMIALNYCYSNQDITGL